MSGLKLFPNRKWPQALALASAVAVMFTGAVAMADSKPVPHPSVKAPAKAPAAATHATPSQATHTTPSAGAARPGQPDMCIGSPAATSWQAPPGVSHVGTPAGAPPATVALRLGGVPTHTGGMAGGGRPGSGQAGMSHASGPHMGPAHAPSSPDTASTLSAAVVKSRPTADIVSEIRSHRYGHPPRSGGNAPHGG